jgi:CheY-like chemotaxis protein
MPSSGVEVLVLEDELAVSEVISDFLLADGCKVKCAATPSEALVLLKDYRPQILFVDLELPKINGITFLQNMENDHVKLPPCVLMTGKGDIDYEGAYRSGVSFVLHKPRLFNGLVWASRQVAKALTYNYERKWIRKEFGKKAILGPKMVEVMNISCGGIQVKVPENFDAKGATLLSVIHNNKIEFSTTVSCIWSSSDMAGYRFANLDYDSRGNILRFISQIPVAA